MIADLLPIGIKESGKQESRKSRDLSSGVIKKAGSSETPVIAPPAQNLPKQRGRPRLPDYQCSPDVLRMRRVYERARTKNGYVRKGRGIRYESGHGVCGLRDVGEKILSDAAVDMAMKYFWGKRGKPVPSATMGGILPSASDFNEEVTMLQMRTSL